MTCAGGTSLSCSAVQPLPGRFRLARRMPRGLIGWPISAVRRGAMWGRFGEIHCRPASRQRLIGMISMAIDQVLLSDKA